MNNRILDLNQGFPVAYWLRLNLLRCNTMSLKKDKKLIEYPEKLVIEPTTRCNFNCKMCVKQSNGCQIAEGDLNQTIFSRCEPLLPHLKTIIFTGIGEPLLNKDLEEFVSKAKLEMPENSIRGFQTNGKLLTDERAVSLVKSGVNKICISMDSVQPALFDSVRNGGQLSDVDIAFDALNLAKEKVPESDLSIGIEFVLMNKNMDELPLVINYAYNKAVDFVIVTHLTAYEKEMEDQIIYLDNSFEALELFEGYRTRAIENDIDLTLYNKILWKVNKSEKDVEIYKLIAALKDEALDKGLYLNLYHLLIEVIEGPDKYNRIKGIFDTAEIKAKEYGIDLILPEIRPKTDRECKFVEDHTIFVTWDGYVSPCYFLWHKYETMRNGYVKEVSPHYFGNVSESSSVNRWNDEEFKLFRQRVKEYDYPNCHAWCETRCDYALVEPFYQDCYINEVPCGDCYWSLGLLNCLI